MITPIEQFAIDKAKELRLKNNISQIELASLLKKSSGFVGKVESINNNNKYNLNHINELAKIFKVSPKDFIPNTVL